MTGFNAAVVRQLARDELLLEFDARVDRLRHLSIHRTWPVVGELRRYIADRLPPGDFLTAVLENNLGAAAILADEFNRPRLCDIVVLCTVAIPAVAWGSPGKVAAWLNGVEVV